MWYESENGEAIRPSEIDATSSRVYVYLRRNITLVPEETGDDPRPAHYRWEETKIPRDTWVIMQKAISHDEALDDVYAALTEVAEMVDEIMGGEN